MKLAAIASALGAVLENGSPDTEISGVAGIEEAGPGQITFVSNPQYIAHAKTTKASAVIVAENFPAIPAAVLKSKNPYLCWAKTIELFYQPPGYAPGIHPTAVVHPSAKIGANAHLGPYVVVEEGVEIGPDAVLLAHVVIYRGVRIGKGVLAHAHSVVREFCRLGDNVILQNGAIVGGDGFGFAKDEEGHWYKIVQAGPTVLGNDVEVQANACIDRASVGETYIGNGVKIDNLAQIGHGSRVGDDTLLCAQVGLAGSTEIGRSAILAGQVGVAGHCKIGDKVIITAQSGTHGDIPAGSTISGSPGFDHKQWLRCTAAFPKLPEMVRALRAREKK